MPEYRIRVDEVPGFDRLALERYLEKYADQHLLVRHELPSNIHYHIWIDTKYADSTIRMMITSKMPYLKGNGGHSVQACDPARRDEYLQYMFNRKQGNRAYFVSEKGFPNWEEYKERAEKATEEFLTKKGSFTKNDCVEAILAEGKEYTIDELFDRVISLTRKHKVVFSVNAIRDIIVYAGYNGGDRDCRGTVKGSVLRIFSFT